MAQSSSKYPYYAVHQMHPLLPSEPRLDGLRPLAAQVIGDAKDLAAHGMPHLRDLLRDALRPMNSYYTNKIEGQHTEPLLIEQAMQQDFSSKPAEARKQRIAVAHIATEQWGEQTFPAFDSSVFFEGAVVQAIHRHLHDQLSPADLTQIDDEGREETIVPGAWRTRGVKVGAHIPPDPATVPAFMDEWQRGYRHARAGETAVIALMAAHHRLAWIHPFLDGNGRTARLHTHLGLSALGLTQGLWSPMRGLAREQSSYYAYLIAADQPRQGDYDGRGVLSEKGLVDFIEFGMNICLDQVRFMNGMLDMRAFEARLAQMLAAEGTREATRYLRAEAAQPLAWLGTVSGMDRARFKGMMGLAARTADRVLADLLTLGIVRSRTPKGPIELALPLNLFRYLFPRLWPEAESNTA
ncbi:Fic family protein [Paraburkholderia sartisoli]|uniref:Fic family protein n=1 Tax=Paraburkholderia sartisoli TaxID=83784 RepID=A0A1H4F7R8_9BURK|nr:Fic family protein [Paraburkholderia sartisoli]SEA93405.1 Fic family protein [Paraburkholderia sartisoli]